jgi:hypothetical protein
MPGGERYELMPTADDRFFAIPAGPTRFEAGADGKVHAVVAGNDRLERAP